MKKYLLFFLFILFIFIIYTNDIEPFETHLKKIEQIYGTGCGLNSKTSAFSKLLQKWENIANIYHLKYSLAYGTLLGQVRHSSFIPYDDDMDIYLGKSSIDKLLKLSNLPWCIYTKDLLKTPIKSDIVLLLNYDHNKPLDNSRKRFNCLGKVTKSHIDSCAFNGPLGRLIYFSNKLPGGSIHLDIFSYSDIEDVDRRQQLEKKKEAKRFYKNLPVYIASKHASELPKTVKCRISNISTKCFENTLVKKNLSTIYGNQYLKPDHRCVNGKYI